MPELTDHLEIQTIDGVTLVTFLDKHLSNYEALIEIGDHLCALAYTGKTKIVLDLSRVEYVTNIACDKFITLYRIVTTSGGQLVLCYVNSRVMDTFTVTGLNKLLTFGKNLSESLSVFS